MKRTFIKAISFMTIIAMLTCFAAGCGKDSDASSSSAEEGAAKQTVSVALLGAQLLEDYAPWLQEQYPDVDFDFYVGTNSTDYVNWCADNGTLADIVTVRRFSLRDVEGIKDKLLDLSGTDLASTFYQSYLKNYTYSDGVVNWLPACAEIDDILINKTLFEQYGIEVPTDYESFVSACEAFAEVGILGYAADFDKDYTCMMTLQGLASADLTSAEGRQWRLEYESNETNALSEDVWLPAFEKLQNLIDKGVISNDILSEDELTLAESFYDGKIAMMRATGASIANYETDYEIAMMPYFGDSEEDSWYLTYPSFQVAANAECTEDSEREELIVDIMTTMLSEDGLNHISEGQNMVAYNKDVDLDLMDELSNLEKYINDNQIYVRIASSEMFSISQDVVTKMISGEITTAADALNAFNEELADDTVATEPTVMHLDRSYSHEFKSDGGNEAASAIYNTVREKLGVDCVLGQSAIAGGDIPEGDYTETQMKFVTVGWDVGSLLKMNLTGSELKSLVQYMLDSEGTRDSVASNSTLPASSGFEMEIKKTDDGYTVEKLTKDGEEMSDDKTYSVVMRVTYSPNIKNLEAAGFTEYETLEDKVKTILNDRLVLNSEQLSEPTDYITLSED